MCTVTFIPSGNSFFITSNRDEQPQRPPAVTPSVYERPSGRLIYPQDRKAGGTWIAAHENGNAVIFLNGAGQAHIPQPPYRKSRGLILLDLIDHPTPYNCFLAINLNNIEPFTAVVFDNGHLFECFWNGKKKSYTELEPEIPHLWNSVTLYDETITSKRQLWFKDWLQNNPQPRLEDILHFHEFAGEGNIHQDLLINRNGQISTVSITALEIGGGLMTMNYLDVNNRERSIAHLMFDNTMVGR